MPVLQRDINLMKWSWIHIYINTYLLMWQQSNVPRVHSINYRSIRCFIPCVLLYSYQSITSLITTKPLIQMQFIPTNIHAALQAETQGHQVLKLILIFPTNNSILIPFILKEIKDHLMWLQNVTRHPDQKSICFFKIL